MDGFAAQSSSGVQQGKVGTPGPALAPAKRRYCFQRRLTAETIATSEAVTVFWLIPMP